MKYNIRTGSLGGSSEDVMGSQVSLSMSDSKALGDDNGCD